METEMVPPPTTHQIEETVKGILREADMDQMTEFKLRISASTKLGFELSDTDHKKLVRDVLESFLLSNPDDEAVHDEANVQETVSPVDPNPTLTASTGSEEEERFVCKLSKKRHATVQKYRGQAFVSIGESSLDNKKPFRGVHLSVNQWSVIKENFAAIEEGIKQSESKLKSESKQNGDTSKPVENNNTTTCSFSIIETSRFDGRSYLRWASQMELFLKQLNLSYVLFEPCPVVTNSPSQADASGKNWLKDDYLCYTHLLNSLSDHLHRQYSKKFKHAKELWDELKWVYQCEESNSKRSQVRKYIEFKMVEERPVLDQVQEFNKIADSIVSAGMFLDETFHVSTIISKFPPSWRGFSTRLMEEEFLPVWMLMERVKAEEEGPQRVTYRPATGSCQMERMPQSLGRGSQSIGWKRKEPERDGRVSIVCDNCGRRGHLAKNCWGKTLEERASSKPNRVTFSSTTHVGSETHAATKNDKE
ncbi:unnamed protein product [Eruca vesicaria subsp. sativa]|uniref:CCHC-type domain-containing protein n=1 Tax=Eruca vesicaria subsp. sativa TaxID=29727 RepID=A0ABC8JX50_ERUVS|nr:unnamed protein product [Eruca vesicaria subsp. sativa]